MIAEHTRKAILALIAVDEGATEVERQAIAKVLSGIQGEPDVVTVKEVCARLGRSRQTVYKLLAAGLLKPVRSSGKYNTGITAQSLADYISSTTQKRN